MSTWLIITLGAGGTVLILAAVAWLVVKLDRSYLKEEAEILSQLQAEIPRRGWVYAERNDAIAQLYTQLQKQFWRRNPVQPFVGAPRAHKARKVVTGVHRGRPFVAAALNVTYDGKSHTTTWIAVRAPAVRPPVTVTRSVPLQSAVNNALWGEMRIGHPDFDQKFDVQTHDPRFAAAMLGPALVDYLMGVELKGRFWGFTLLGDNLDFFGPSSGFGDHRVPANLVAALDLRCDVLDRIPAGAWA